MLSHDYQALCLRLKMLERPSVLNLFLTYLYVFHAVDPRVCAPVDQTTNYFTPASGADIGGGRIPIFGFDELQGNSEDNHWAWAAKALPIRTTSETASIRIRFGLVSTTKNYLDVDAVRLK